MVRRPAARPLLAILIALAATGGCSGGGTAVDAGGGDDGGDGGCPAALGGASGPQFAQTSSRFDLGAYPDWLTFSGGVYDGPKIEFHQEAERQGACRLLTYQASFCDPACQSGQACIAEQCVDYPALQSVGTVTLGGVGTTGIPVAPVGDGSYSWSTQDFGAGDLAEISLDAPGAVGPGFSVAACTPPPLEPTADWSALLEQRADGQDVTLEWSNPIDWTRVYIRMTTGIGTHGGISPVEIECEGRDTGSLTLPGSYLDALYADGWSCGECGGNDLIRYHAGEVDAGDRRIQLRIGSSSSFWYRPI